MYVLFRVTLVCSNMLTKIRCLESTYSRVRRFESCRCRHLFAFVVPSCRSSSILLSKVAFACFRLISSVVLCASAGGLAASLISRDNPNPSSSALLDAKRNPGSTMPKFSRFASTCHNGDNIHDSSCCAGCRHHSLRLSSWYVISPARPINLITR